MFLAAPISIGASLAEEQREIEGVVVGYYSAKISWATDEPATSQVDYGTSGFIYEQSSPERNSLLINHEIILSNLKPSTLYHYRIRSKDAFGNEGVSQDLTFKTLDFSIADNKAPTISNIKVASLAGVKEPTYLSDEEAAAIIGAGPAAPKGNFPGGKIIAVAKAKPKAEPKAETRHIQEGSEPAASGMIHSAGQLTKHEAPVEKTLVQKGGLLMPKGTWQYEPSFAYAHTSANRIAISGFTVLPVLIIGSISVDEVKRDILIQTNTFRYGLFNNFQVEVKVPSHIGINTSV